MGADTAATSALGELGGWCTRFMGILDIGRCTNIVEEEGEDEEKLKGPAPQPHISAHRDAQGAKRVDPTVWGIARPCLRAWHSARAGEAYIRRP